MMMKALAATTPPMIGTLPLVLVDAVGVPLTSDLSTISISDVVYFGRAMRILCAAMAWASVVLKWASVQVDAGARKGRVNRLSKSQEEVWKCARFLVAQIGIDVSWGSVIFEGKYLHKSDNNCEREFIRWNNTDVESERNLPHS